MNSNENDHLKKAFLDSQKARLRKLCQELEGNLSAVSVDESQQTLINSEAREQEDDAQKLDALERAGLQEKHNAVRLEAIKRALASIDDGSYGISIVSGKKIPQARLEVVPEALWNVDEEPE